MQVVQLADHGLLFEGGNRTPQLDLVIENDEIDQQFVDCLEDGGEGLLFGMQGDVHPEHKALIVGFELLVVLFEGVLEGSI
jgi:hypothetical protein